MIVDQTTWLSHIVTFDTWSHNIDLYFDLMLVITGDSIKVVRPRMALKGPCRAPNAPDAPQSPSSLGAPTD